jgi:hypothetical protein
LLSDFISRFLSICCQLTNLLLVSWQHIDKKRDIKSLNKVDLGHFKNTITLFLSETAHINIIGSQGNGYIISENALNIAKSELQFIWNRPAIED